MHKARLSLIAAVAENGVIGVNNTLPWHLPADLRRFRALTSGHHIVMGRKTCESLGEPLRDRFNLVVSRNPKFIADGFIVVSSLEAALAAVRGDKEVFVIGGASVYSQVLPRAGHFYLTRVHAEFSGDACFPDFDRNDWSELRREEHTPDARHAYAYSFITLERKSEG